MDSQEQVLIRRCAHNICREKEFPAEEGRLSQEVCGKDLDRDNEEDDVFCERFWTTEFRDL